MLRRIYHGRTKLELMVHEKLFTPLIEASNSSILINTNNHCGHTFILLDKESSLSCVLLHILCINNFCNLTHCINVFWLHDRTDHYFFIVRRLIREIKNK